MTVEMPVELTATGITGLVLLGAMILDFAIGDPPGMPHPVVAIGKLAARLETITRRFVAPESFAGLTASVGLITIVAIVSFGLLKVATLIHPVLGPCLAALMIWVTIAARSMVDHSSMVYAALTQDDITAAREKTGWIVGRETSELNRDDLIRATVESVAESTVDGVTGVLFYATMGGLLAGWQGAALGALVFRTINTLDSMYGYRNERYLMFGRFAARLDDVAGFLPARLTPAFLALAALLMGEQAAAAWRMFLRDGSNHLSPNAGQCEAAFAGALGIQLGGTNVYHGNPVPKPTIGDALAAREPEHIRRANALLLTGSMLFAVFAAGLFFVLDFLG